MLNLFVRSPTLVFLRKGSFRYAEIICFDRTKTCKCPLYTVIEEKYL
jgi:hypothetical protein